MDPVDVLIAQRGGRATGEAIAVLSHPAEMDIAMRKNKAYMGSRYIELFLTTEDERARFQPVQGGGGGAPHMI